MVAVANKSVGPSHIDSMLLQFVPAMPIFIRQNTNKFMLLPLQNCVMLLQLALGTPIAIRQNTKKLMLSFLHNKTMCPRHANSRSAEHKHADAIFEDMRMAWKLIMKACMLWGKDMDMSLKPGRLFNIMLTISPRLSRTTS